MADCTTYKQGMKSLGYAPDEEDMSQMEEHEFYSGLIIKIGARCFFCNQEGHLRMDCPLFWEAVKNQSHPKHKLALAAEQNQRNRQGEFETKDLERPNAELPTKTVKAVTQGNSAVEATAKNTQEIDYEKAAAEAINKVKQDLAAKEIEQRLKQEIQRQKMNEALSCSQTIPEAAEGSTKNGNCNTVKMVTGKPFGITKIGARIMSIIIVGGHEVTRNLSEPSDQTIMHIDVYADYLSCISPQTTSRALRALLTRGGSKSVRVDNRYTEAYGPHEVMLNIDGINIYTKTMITCDEDLIGQIYVGREELKVRSIGNCAMLEEDAMHIGTEADVTGHVLDISCKKTQLRGLLDTGVVLSVIPIKTWERMGFDKDDLIDLMIKKLREVREKCGLELEGEEAEPTIGRNFKTKFEIPNEYSENILITDSDFILSDRTSAICITADMSFKSRLEADFKREYQNVEFLFRQRPGLGGMAALPPSVAQVPGKYLCFLVTRVNDRNTIDPEHVILALTRLRDFMIERGITEVSMPVYDPNRWKLSPKELYAILHVVFAETEIMVHLHKKYYLSIA